MTTAGSGRRGAGIAASNENPPGPDRGGTVIFVVDDDPALVDSLSDVLSDEGYRVECFTEPAEALNRLVAGARPGALLLDHVMPGMSGPEFLDGMAAARVEVPVLLLSGLSDPDIRPGMVAGILSKPFDIDRLLLEIDRMIVLPASGA